jgi:hypothetical protein
MKYIRGMHGLGDNIYQRGFIKSLPYSVYLETPWPQIYQGIDNIKFVVPNTKLRTQSKNLSRNDLDVVWENIRPETIPNIVKIHYGRPKGFRGIIREMGECFDVRPPEKFDLPDFLSEFPWIQDLGEFALIRPVTERSEWFNKARNPKAEYIAKSAEMLKDSGIKIVSIADLKLKEEWLVKPEPYADKKFHKGELSVKELLALVQAAKYTIGGVGWIVPASLCYNNRAWIVLGGHGMYNSPEVIMYRQPNQVEFAKPDEFCRCTNMQHDCNKEIKNYEHKFAEWLRG